MTLIAPQSPPSFGSDPPSPRLARSLVRVNRDQCHKMIEDGIIPDDATTELLDGLIVYKNRGDSPEDFTGHGPKHRVAVRLLTKLAALYCFG